MSWRAHLRQRRASGGAVASAGYTLAELMMVCAILVTLAAVTFPVAKFTQKRIKEAELRAHLRT
ncbi:MAG: hypothetical protein AAGA81_20830, partial [Acidobacteriota bacterium]